MVIFAIYLFVFYAGNASQEKQINVSQLNPYMASYTTLFGYDRQVIRAVRPAYTRNTEHGEYSE